MINFNLIINNLFFFQIHIYKKYMHLEPIGCLFIIAFVFILSIQFLAMLHHRLNTFVHVLANIKLNLFYPIKVI